jgi:hypothetical protein
MKRATTFPAGWSAQGQLQKQLPKQTVAGILTLDSKEALINSVIARSDATKQSRKRGFPSNLDCFATLAMTRPAINQGFPRVTPLTSRNWLRGCPEPTSFKSAFWR